MADLSWFETQAKSFINKEIDKLFNRAGRAAVAESRRVVHVRTGDLRASIGYTYRNSDRTLQFHADAYYAIWEELGTRYRGPHPFLAPGIEAAARVLGNPGFMLRGGMRFSGASIGGRTQLHFANVRATKTHAKKYQLARIQQQHNVTMARLKGLGRYEPNIIFHAIHPGSLLKFKIPHKHKIKYLY